MDAPRSNVESVLALSTGVVLLGLVVASLFS